MDEQWDIETHGYREQVLQMGLVQVDSRHLGGQGAAKESELADATL